MAKFTRVVFKRALDVHFWRQRADKKGWVYKVFYVEETEQFYVFIEKASQIKGD